ncbi:hypothetical protein PCANC_02189 [Puccinia coronata f. sp. avenae]|uniref:Uncharacterized protein n=1 Tax=Puccinia coronata f. sp. avenae TaxID=200324 RepID=A0A2N5W135_9BASI|nr:hypothetical protein PCANC_02189 [Puccinia coronata f. sp. avenae]
MSRPACPALPPGKQEASVIVPHTPLLNHLSGLTGFPLSSKANPPACHIPSNN